MLKLFEVSGFKNFKDKIKFIGSNQDAGNA